jgi:hypothetical protein
VKSISKSARVLVAALIVLLLGARIALRGGVDGFSRDLIVLGVLLVLIGGGFYVAYRTFMARNWICIKGRVIVPDPSWVDAMYQRGIFGGQFDAKRMRYSYEHNGQRYESEKISPADLLDVFGLSGRPDLATAMKTAFEKSEDIVVWVNPREPSDSALTNRVSGMAVFLYVSATLFGIFVYLLVSS